VLCPLRSAFHFNTPHLPHLTLIQRWGVVMRAMGRRLDGIGPEERQLTLCRLYCVRCRN
jgi:hypothetical protein